MEDFHTDGLLQAVDRSTDSYFIRFSSLVNLLGFYCCMCHVRDRIQSEMGQEYVTCALTMLLEQVPEVPSMIPLAFAVCSSS